MVKPFAPDHGRLLPAHVTRLHGGTATMTTTTRTQKPDINEMRVIHRVFRRELAALPGLVRRVPDDVDRAEVVAQVPAPIRLVLRTVGARQHRRCISASARAELP